MRNGEILEGKIISVAFLMKNNKFKKAVIKKYKD